jgi:hypothetical protein
MTASGNVASRRAHKKDFLDDRRGKNRRLGSQYIWTADAAHDRAWCPASPAFGLFGKRNIVMNANNATKVTLEQRIRGLIAGTQKHSPNGSLTFGGTTFTAQVLVQDLQSLADALAATDVARAAWKDALKNAVDTRAKVLPTMESYRSWVVATYGNAPSTLADYGMSPRKVRTPLTAEQKATAALKRTATRQARMTLGKNQKKAIKGTVPAPASPSNAVHAQTQAPSASTPTATPALKAAS